MLAAHIRLALPGSITMPLIRPPMLPGPIHCQAATVSPASPGAGSAAATGPVGTPAVCVGGSVTAATYSSATAVSTAVLRWLFGAARRRGPA